MTDNKRLEEQVSELSSQVEDLSKKVDNLNAKVEKLDSLDEKIDKVEKNTAKMVEQTQQIVAATSAVRAETIMRQHVSNPTGFIGREVSTYVFNTFMKNPNNKTKTWIAAKGPRVVESMISSFVSQKLPQLNWNNSTITTSGDGVVCHHTARTNFPVIINTGVPFLGNITIAKVILDVDSDVNTVTNETSNIKCRMSSDQPQKELMTGFKEDFANMIRPHKFWSAILFPIGRGIERTYNFMKRETRFSIPFLIAFLITLFQMRFPPAAQLWVNVLHFPQTYMRILGFGVMNIFYGIVNGIIWGFVSLAVIKFHIFPGIGKGIHFLNKWIFTPTVRKWRASKVWRYAMMSGMVVIIALIVVWRMGVFSPPPLTLTSAGLSNAEVGVVYSDNITVTGGRLPYSWTQDTNSIIPPGLTLDSVTGKLSGSPTSAGVYNLIVKVQDKSKTIITKNLSMQVFPTGQLAVSNSYLPAGALKQDYIISLKAFGGTAPYAWRISAGALPDGLLFNSTTATISGVPTKKGDFTFGVTVSDNAVPAASYTQNLTISIK